MRGVLQQLAPDFEKSAGHHLVIEYATAGKVEEKVAADEAIDVAILTKPRAEKLVRSAELVSGTVTVLARVPIGLVVRKARRTLISARSKRSNARCSMPNRSPMLTRRAAVRAASSWHRPSKSSASPLRSNPSFASFRRPPAKARRELARSSSGARPRSAYSRSAN